LSRARVLLADDHEEFLAMEARLLEVEFEVVTTARGGREALDKAAEFRPDALVLDVSMPGLSGIETARQLRATGSLAKVVFLTVHGDPDCIRAALATGAAAYVVKSRLASDLIPALREALAGRSFVSPSIRMD
jgi:DNA-binding NarL/FixJ family response regulator